ncbi:MAG: YigZ family protein [Clostridiales bacterium]|nr:YigZ family protein [Clostridiales bacterium]
MIVCVNEGEYELVIKKSRFIAISRHIETRDDVKPIIDALKAEHVGARHVCYGYIADEKGDDFGYDDNGEPTGTAGKPIYSALAASDARKTCIAVVRYFGGIKLGAGGLTRAYRQSAADLIAQVGVSKAEKQTAIEVCCTNDAYKRVSAVLRGLSGAIEQIRYEASVSFTAVLPTENAGELTNTLDGLKAEYRILGERYASVQ